MRAIVQHGYGEPEQVLSLAEVARPTISADEVLVRVRAASVHPDVWHVVTGRPYVLRIMGAGLFRPSIPVPGTDLSGQVVEVGANVTRFSGGEEVLGECVRGHQWHNGGAFAEYAAVSADALALKAPNVSFEQAAAVPTSGLIALNNLRALGGLAAGMNVLINGAAGCVGSLAVQIAKAMGATVTGVDRADRLELLHRVGADRVIDYLQEDFARRSERYDLILDIPGSHTFKECQRALTANGVYVFVGHDHFGSVGRRWLGSVPRGVGLLVRSLWERHLPRPGQARGPSARIDELGEWLGAGKLLPVIDRVFGLHEAAAAVRYLAAGSARGRIVLSA